MPEHIEIDKRNASTAKAGLILSSNASSTSMGQVRGRAEPTAPFAILLDSRVGNIDASELFSLVANAAITQVAPVIVVCATEAPRRSRFRSLLDSWMRDDPEEQRDTLAGLERDLDAHRESPRKLFESKKKQ